LVVVWALIAVGVTAIGVGLGSADLLVGPALSVSLFAVCMVRSMKQRPDAVKRRSTLPPHSQLDVEGQSLLSLLGLVFWSPWLHFPAVAISLTAVAYLLVLYEAGYRWTSLRDKTESSSTAG
jgi:hypothetical protein